MSCGVVVLMAEWQESGQKNDTQNLLNRLQSAPYKLVKFARQNFSCNLYVPQKYLNVMQMFQGKIFPNVLSILEVLQLKCYMHFMFPLF
jgi:hypothetical protein